MEISVVVHILVLVFFLAVQVTGKCRKEHFAQRLGRYPDAWRILRNTTQQYFLAGILLVQVGNRIPPTLLAYSKPHRGPSEAVDNHFGLWTHFGQ
uniref:Putative secreted protein n=1 Tax=Ixodes ricinus TaxID=34613 RepID=A0A6B0U3R1_IXORI